MAHAVSVRWQFVLQKLSARLDEKDNSGKILVALDGCNGGGICLVSSVYRSYFVSVLSLCSSLDSALKRPRFCYITATQTDFSVNSANL